ncbi:MAG: tetratricopeptide repeat protein [Planctomycetaceae bacterium]
MNRPPRARRTIALLIGLVLLLLVGLWSGAAARVPLAFADGALWRRDDDRAAYWAGLAKRIDRTNVDAEFVLARVARRDGRFDDAADHVSAARSLGADATKARREEMLVLAQIGRLDGIEEPLNAWLAEADLADRREICEAYSNGLARIARFDHAIGLLEAWRLDFPDDAEPLYRLGRLLEHLRQPREAEEKYRAALERNPQHHPAAYRLGSTLLERREVEEALKYFRVCAELPHPVAANVGMGRCLKALGRVDEARPLFEAAANADEAVRVASYKAVGEPAERFLAATELGTLEAEAGRYESAERWLSQAVERNPRDSEARYSLAIALRGLGRREEAAREFERVRKTQQAFEEAGELHNRIDLKPGDVDARYRLGVILLEHDSERTGIYWLNTALEYDPHHAPTHRALADLFAAKADESPEFRRLAEKHERQAGPKGQAPSAED